MALLFCLTEDKDVSLKSFPLLLLIYFPSSGTVHRLYLLIQPAVLFLTQHTDEEEACSVCLKQLAEKMSNLCSPLTLDMFQG